MIKHKKKIIDVNANIQSNINKSIYKDEIKASRVSITSRHCNEAKFNQVYQLIDSTKEFKKTISIYCFNNLYLIHDQYSEFLTHYTQFISVHLNSWERQTVYQEIAGHYYETITRHLNKAKYIVKQYRQYRQQPSKTPFVKLAYFIHQNSTMTADKTLLFNPTDKVLELNNSIQNYIEKLNALNDKIKKDNEKEKLSLEKRIKFCHNLINNYNEIILFSQNKPVIYQRLINLIQNKKLRLFNKVKLAEYSTGTHARNLNNAQISIVEDLSNKEFQYFAKIRIHDTLIGREPKRKDNIKLSDSENQSNYQQLLEQYNEKNFVYLPITYNNGKLKSINKNIKEILSKDNPQILLKTEQLRINPKSRKIHIIFQYKEKNPLGELIENSIFNHQFNTLEANELNTLGLDINSKHNLLADSKNRIYDDILNNDSENTSKTTFIDNVNEIVLLQSIPTELRTEKQKYRYQKILRINESLLKTYLSGLIKDWKQENILHLVLEDLNIQDDKTYYEHAGVKIKYSRLARLLRLNHIKDWIAEMATKQQLFTHFVNPAYTSQECNICHYIDENNRKIQEIFQCMNKHCNHTENADINSSKTIKNRYLNINLRHRLGKDNVYLCSRTNSIYYKRIKDLVMNEYKFNHNLNKNGVVTELLSDTILV